MTCTSLCTQNTKNLGWVAPVTAPAVQNINIFIGPTFWNTLLLIPLATVDLLVSFLTVGPLLLATEDEIYNSTYSFFSKLLAFLESPGQFLVFGKWCFELKCLLFDDSDGCGLGMIVFLQWITWLIQSLHYVKRLKFAGTHIHMELPNKADIIPPTQASQGQQI
jgi:hypothetical protein